MKLDVFNMAARGLQLCCLVAIVLAVPKSTGDGALKRKERAAAGFVANFVIDKLVSVGLDILLDQILEKDYTPYLDEIKASLAIMEANFDNALTSLEEIKELFTVSDALKIERRLQVYVTRFHTIVEALGILNDSTATNMTEEYHLLKMDIMEFKRDVKEVPDLLVELHQLIIGKSIVSSGKTSGLACQRVDYERRQLEIKTPQNYNISLMIQNIRNYRDSLMKLQVNSFQLRNNTCSVKDLKCPQEAVQLEKHLRAQNQRFEDCIPQYLKYFSQHDSLDNIHIIDDNLKMTLYIKQSTSVVVDGILDWDRIDSPQDQGLRCAPENTSDVWSLITCPGCGFYLMDKTGCFLSFDSRFIHYKKNVPTFWTDSDKISRDEFLICLPSVTRDAVSFLLYATSSQHNTSYYFKEVTTMKYLHVHEKKTSVHDKINERLVLVLFLDDKKLSSWILVPDGKYKGHCNDTSKSSESKEDHGYISIIGGTVGGTIGLGLLVLSARCIRKKCCQTRNDEQWRTPEFSMDDQQRTPKFNMDNQLILFVIADVRSLFGEVRDPRPTSTVSRC